MCFSIHISLWHIYFIPLLTFTFPHEKSVSHGIQLWTFRLKLWHRSNWPSVREVKSLGTLFHSCHLMTQKKNWTWKFNIWSNHLTTELSIPLEFFNLGPTWNLCNLKINWRNTSCFDSSLIEISKQFNKMISYFLSHNILKSIGHTFIMKLDKKDEQWRMKASYCRSIWFHSIWIFSALINNKWEPGWLNIINAFLLVETYLNNVRPHNRIIDKMGTGCNRAAGTENEPNFRTVISWELIESFLS